MERFFQRHACGECCGYQFNITRRLSAVLFLRNLARRTRWNTKTLEQSFFKKKLKRRMSWRLTRCVILYHFLCGRKRLQITFCLGRCEFGFTILWNTRTFWQLWRLCGFCSNYHEWKEYYNAKNSISSKRAFHNSPSKFWFCLKSLFVQIYSGLLVYYLDVLHSDAGIIWGCGGSAGLDKQFV